MLFAMLSVLTMKTSTNVQLQLFWRFSFRLRPKAQICANVDMIHITNKLCRPPTVRQTSKYHEILMCSLCRRVGHILCWPSGFRIFVFALFGCSSRYYFWQWNEMNCFYYYVFVWLLCETVERLMVKTLTSFVCCYDIQTCQHSY